MKNYYWDGESASFLETTAIKSVGESHGYKKVKIGDPLIIQYLRFNLMNAKLTEEKKNEIIITTRVKEGPQMEIAPEMVNYFKMGIKAPKGYLSVSDIGAGTYGHKLCYYDEHYKGQDIKLTVQALELDSIKKNEIEFMQNTISSFSELPYISSVKLPDGMISNLVLLGSNIYNFINRDDVLIDNHDIDLYFKPVNQPTLKSGRYVLIQDDYINIKDYKLTDDNQLMRLDGIDNSITYVVLQVNNKKHSQYKDFKLYQSASKYLSLINKNNNMQAYVDNITKMADDYNDVDMMMKADKIVNKYDAKYENIKRDDRELLKAYINSMSDNMKPKYDDIMKLL